MFGYTKQDMIVIGLLLGGTASVIGGYDHWLDVLKPQSISGIMMVWASIIAARWGGQSFERPSTSALSPAAKAEVATILADESKRKDTA